MADQKDQGTDPPAEKPSLLPLKKITTAENLLVGDGTDHDEEANKETPEELQLKAFYAVLQALTLETSTMSNKRTQLIGKLMNEWEIPNETHISIADNIQKKLLTVQQTEKSSHDTESQILPETPLTEHATPSSTIVPKSGKSWGSVNPESIVGKYFRIRLEGDAKFQEYIIHAYDKKKDKHRILTPDPNLMEVDDPYSWIDLRDISSKDIMWEVGETPHFNDPNQSASTAS